MVVTRERFEQGMTYAHYKGQMTRNRERLEAYERQVQLDPSDVVVFKNVAQPLNVLALAEDWCVDVLDNLPVLAKIVDQSGNLNLRVFVRDQNPDIMDQYLNRGQYRSIPTWVFFDEQFNEVGRFIERPQTVTDLRARKRLEIFASDPALGPPEAPVADLPEETRIRLNQAITQMREDTRPFANAEVVRELRAIVEGLPSVPQEQAAGRSG